MQINRHNYEEFFLLYVDNELSATEREAVEVFAANNADLKQELLMLQEAVMLPDTFGFDKTSLLKEENEISALQEKLLLFADNELPANEIKATKALIAADATAAKEWSILQQTKLSADTSIVFKDKASLYRKEGGKVVAFKWWRVAAAAVVLGFTVWGGLTVYKNSATAPGIKGEVAKNNGVKKQPVIIKTTDPVITGPVTNPVDENATLTAQQKNNQQQLPVTNTISNTVVNKKDKAQDLKNDNDAVAIQALDNNKKPSNNLPKPLENINRDNSNIIAYNNVTPKNNESNTNSGQSDATVKSNKSNDTETNPYKAIAVVNNDDQNRFPEDDDKSKRTRLGGFFRKVKRVVERTANIKPGDGVRVAGFEIASN